MDAFVSSFGSDSFRIGNLSSPYAEESAAAAGCGVIDSCSPFYRSYVRAVRWLAEQCQQFYGESYRGGVESLVEQIMLGRISPNHDDFVVLNGHLSTHERAGSTSAPGLWLEKSTANMIRDVQRDLATLQLRGDAPPSYPELRHDVHAPYGSAGLQRAGAQFLADCCAEPPPPPPPPPRMKANTTECVPVPSSEHVAEIVGKKGGKIKNIRAETNTYIKTPKRDEEPVFVITGRKEDVAFAKQKILAAAEHFSQLREARRQNPGGPAPALGPPKRDGDVTVSVEVPYEFVGLVVGQKGATIKRIQQDTGTYITTPSRRHRPIFEVVGQPSDVERARQAIQMHINSRVEKFRSESLPGGGGGAGGGDEPFRASSSLSFLNGLDDSVFGAPSAAGLGLLGGLGDASLAGTWMDAPPPAPGRRAEPVSPLTASLRALSMQETAAAAAASAPMAWSSADGRARTASLPTADACESPAMRRGSADLPPPPPPPPAHLSQLMMRLPTALGWGGQPEQTATAATVGSAAQRRSPQGSSETLNSDSGIETTTPPPVDGATFGPIGSKRTSPTSLAGSE